MDLRTIAGALCCTVLLGGCGTYVPQIAELMDTAADDNNPNRHLELSIKKAIYCELKDAVVFVRSGAGGRFKHGPEPWTTIPDTWGVQVTLILTVDETGALTPGISPIATLPIHSFTLGAGATASSQATHIHKYSFYYLIRDLEKLGVDDSCYDKGVLVPKETGSSFFLISDLGIKKWLTDAMYVENTDRSQSPPKDSNPVFSQDLIQYETRFIIVTAASLTTDWKIVSQTTVQGMLPTVSANRTRTHDLIITFGESLKPKGNTPIPGSSASNADLAAQIGASLATQLRIAPSTFAP